MVRNKKKSDALIGAVAALSPALLCSEHVHPVLMVTLGHQRELKYDRSTLDRLGKVKGSRPKQDIPWSFAAKAGYLLL